MLNNQQLNELQDVCAQAVECELTTQVPAELTVAQWALESGWGVHQPGNNCFGIKYYEGAPGSQILSTKEFFTLEQVTKWLERSPHRVANVINSHVDEQGRREYDCRDTFVAYKSLTDCFRDRAERILSKGLLGNFLGTYKINKNLVSYVSNVASSYATDPDYATKVLKIMSMPEVIAGIREAKIDINRPKTV